MIYMTDKNKSSLYIMLLYQIILELDISDYFGRIVDNFD